jgi:cyanophycinase
MSALSYNPFISGFGIDEDTAAFISPEGVMEVVGAGAVTVVDPAGLTHSSMHDARHNECITLIGMKLHILGEGSKYDINSREAFA